MTGIKITPHSRTTPTSRATMQNYNRYTISSSALLYVDVMTVTNIQYTLIERLNRWIKKLYCAFLTSDFVHD
jgi:hypothetical protein